jgi:hypothetical protein
MKRGGRARAAAAVAAVGIWLAAATADALCGDAGYDGLVTATDALAALQAATRGDYDPHLDVEPAGAPDGRLRASDALRVLVSAVAATIPSCAAATESRAIVGTSSCDFVTGGIGEIDIATLAPIEHHAGRIDGDAVLREQDGRFFALNRFGGDNVQELDPDDGYTTLWQCSTGPGSNPHDIVLVADDKAYVTRYDATSILIVDPSVGPTCAGFTRGTIDLSSLADADTIPEMEQAVLVGNRLFVAIQRLDRKNFFVPAANGALAVIDTATDQLVGSIELELANPFAETKGLVYHPPSNRIYVAGPGTLFTDLDDGGIEVVDPDAMASAGVLITGAALGGDLTDFAPLGTSRGFAIVADAEFAASVVEIDLSAGAVTGSIVRSELLLSDIELAEAGTLWLADRDCFDPGVRVFVVGAQRGAVELTQQPIFSGLAPFTILLR